MYRYRFLIYYVEKTTEARVAQVLVVIAKDDAAAVQMAKADVAQNAEAGHSRTVQAVEKLPIAAGVVFRGDPYLPMHWLSAEALSVAAVVPVGARH